MKYYFGSEQIKDEDEFTKLLRNSPFHTTSDNRWRTTYVYGLVNEEYTKLYPLLSFLNEKGFECMTFMIVSQDKVNHIIHANRRNRHDDGNESDEDVAVAALNKFGLDSVGVYHGDMHVIDKDGDVISFACHPDD